MPKLESLIHNKVAQNIFAWFCVFFLVFVVMNDGEGDLGEGVLIFILFAIAIYINNLLIYPYFKRKKIIFTSLFFLNISVFALIATFSVLDEPSVTRYLNFGGNFLLAIFFGVLLKMARDSFMLRQQEKEAELKLLKAQLNPHFLFNTLNNLYGLSVIKSDKLPGLMLQLSDLLRYSLYETKDILVPLEKEMKYLEDYISLEKIRLEEKTKINFSFTGDIVGKQIAPMLLIVFVENAFKHLANTNEEKSSVDIDIEVLDNKLNFSCINTYDSSKINKVNLEKGKSGIGLVNAKKRLEIIYNEAYKLSILKEKEIFKVQLALEV